MIKPLLLLAATTLIAALAPAPMRSIGQDGRVQTRWPNGALERDVNYHAGVYEGEYRAWYQSGHPFELRHYKNGHEEGLQQAWTDEGELYINYEVRGGRHYGLLNSMPCVTVPPDKTGLPYYDSPAFTPKWTPVDHQVAGFSLTTQTGANLTGKELAGRIYVASFIYTKCAALCPLLVAQLARVQKALPPNAAVLSFSVTPEDDTPKALASFGKEHGIDPSRWMLLTGRRADIYNLARTSYFADDNRAGPAAGNSREEFLHTEKLVLVDGHGRLRGVYNGTQPHEIDELIADMRTLRSAGL